MKSLDHQINELCATLNFSKTWPLYS